MLQHAMRRPPDFLGSNSSWNSWIWNKMYLHHVLELLWKKTIIILILPRWIYRWPNVRLLIPDSSRISRIPFFYLRQIECCPNHQNVCWRMCVLKSKIFFDKWIYWTLILNLENCAFHFSDCNEIQLNHIFLLWQWDFHADGKHESYSKEYFRWWAKIKSIII